MLLLLLACAADPSPAPAPPPAEVRVELVYVQASRLTLRNAPEGGALGSLGINTPLRVLNHQGGWIEVTAPSGLSGWVHGDYVAAERVSPEGLDAQIAAETDAEQRLALWQRRAALAPTDPLVLEGLAMAYAATGNEEAAAKVRRAMAAGLERFDGWFPAQKEEVDALRTSLGTVSSAPELARLWARAVVVTEQMGEALNSRYQEDMSFAGGDPEPLFAARIPFAYLATYAEGTWAQLELSPAFWIERAHQTPEPWDEAFLQLVVDSYDNASGRGWAAWQDRNWDYGGCSPFGQGLHQRLLLQTDALAGVPEVAEPVAKIRAAVLRDIEQPEGPGEFPYCDTARSEPTPVATLRAEAQGILDQVRLSTEERAMVERRMATGFGAGTPG